MIQAKTVALNTSKLPTLTYKCKNGSAPDYLHELVQHYHPPRKLCSSSKGLLTAVPAHMKFYGQRSFQYASPRLWNSLPNNLKDCATLEQFKSRLKNPSLQSQKRLETLFCIMRYTRTVYYYYYYYLCCFMLS